MAVNFDIQAAGPSLKRKRSEAGRAAKAAVKQMANGKWQMADDDNGMTGKQGQVYDLMGEALQKLIETQAVLAREFPIDPMNASIGNITVALGARRATWFEKCAAGMTNKMHEQETHFHD